MNYEWLGVTQDDGFDITGTFGMTGNPSEEPENDTATSPEQPEESGA